MLNKLVVCVLLNMMVSVVALAAYSGNQHSVTINLNPSSAQTVPTHQQDVRLNALREQSNQQAAREANAHNKSFVSNAPDPNNPNYWKNKNSEDAQAYSGASPSRNNLVSQQNLQRQTVALQQVLSQLKSEYAKANKVSVVAFTLPKENMLPTHATKTQLKSALALPGTVWYATMDSGADSYIPGPVTAEIQEGPFAGGKAIGKFQVAPDGEHLILTFHTVSFSGRSYSVSAVAIDPNTKISGVTGDIDHHIFTRFIIPGAASFLNAVTQALMNQNQSVALSPSGIVITNQQLNNRQLALMGASGAAKSFADATKPRGVLRLPEVKIASGQGIGFLVLKPIL